MGHRSAPGGMFTGSPAEGMQIRLEQKVVPLAEVDACVTKRRSSWACIGNPKLEQETIEGTHAQETQANHTARGARKQPPNQLSLIHI